MEQSWFSRRRRRAGARIHGPSARHGQIRRGEFSIKGLPAGKYLIAAVDCVQDGQWYDPEFLADLRSRAQRLLLAEAESKRIDLTVQK